MFSRLVEELSQMSIWFKSEAAKILNRQQHASIALSWIKKLQRPEDVKSIGRGKDVLI